MEQDLEKKQLLREFSVLTQLIETHKQIQDKESHNKPERRSHQAQIEVRDKHQTHHHAQYERSAHHKYHHHERRRQYFDNSHQHQKRRWGAQSYQNRQWCPEHQQYSRHQNIQKSHHAGGNKTWAHSDGQSVGKPMSQSVILKDDSFKILATSTIKSSDNRCKQAESIHTDTVPKADSISLSSSSVNPKYVSVKKKMSTQSTSKDTKKEHKHSSTHSKSKNAQNLEIDNLPCEGYISNLPSQLPRFTQHMEKRKGDECSEPMHVPGHKYMDHQQVLESKSSSLNVEKIPNKIKDTERVVVKHTKYQLVMKDNLKNKQKITSKDLTCDDKGASASNGGSAREGASESKVASECKLNSRNDGIGSKYKWVKRSTSSQDTNTTVISPILQMKIAKIKLMQAKARLASAVLNSTTGNTITDNRVSRVGKTPKTLTKTKLKLVLDHSPGKSKTGKIHFSQSRNHGSLPTHGSRKSPIVSKYKWQLRSQTRKIQQRKNSGRKNQNKNVVEACTSNWKNPNIRYATGWDAFYRGREQAKRYRRWNRMGLPGRGSGHKDNVTLMWKSRYSLQRDNSDSLTLNQLLGRQVFNLSKSRYKFIKGDTPSPRRSTGTKVQQHKVKKRQLPNRSQLKVDHRITPESPKLPNERDSSKNRLVLIGGILYKSNKNHLVRTSPKISSRQRRRSASSVVLKNKKDSKTKTVMVRGVRFKVDSSGRTLQRLPSDENHKEKRISRVDIGGVTYIKTKPGTLVRASTAAARYRASQSLYRSIATAVTAKTRQQKREERSQQYCMFYNRFGKCNRGDNCQYIHDSERVAICTRFLRGTCKVTDCSFSHKVSRDKMPVCVHYLRGVCSKEDCPYLHVNVGKDAEICQQFIKGYCALGAKCKKKHTLVCVEWSKTGSCSLGKKCHLLHPLHGTKRKRFNSRKTSTSSTNTPSRSEPKRRKMALKFAEGASSEDADLPMKERHLPEFIALNSNDKGLGNSQSDINVIGKNITEGDKTLQIRPNLSFESVEDE